MVPERRSDFGPAIYDRRMWIARELAKLVIRIVVVTGVTLVVAVVLAAGAGGFLEEARVFALLFGCVLLAMGALGRGSNVERFSDLGVLQAAWGKVPGFDALTSPRADDPRLAPGAALVLSGVVLLALGLTVL